MTCDIKIDQMKKEDIDRAIEIFCSQYERYCGNNDNFPDTWRQGNRDIEEFLISRVDAGRALAARSGNELIGYLCYDVFDFNGESSAFCPTMGHSSLEEFKQDVYHSLYASVSQEWVKQNIFNHMWTIFSNDKELERMLFDLGFGSYLVDVFSKPIVDVEGNPDIDITRASSDDVAVLHELVDETRDFYRSAPLFLRRERISEIAILNIISDGNVFIAWDGDKPVGFINMSVAEDNDTIDLSVAGCGMIDLIGIYIKPEYRSMGIGIGLLKSISDHCLANDIPLIHADFETANLFGNKFWRKHMHPMLLSMRRTINKNVNVE